MRDDVLDALEKVQELAINYSQCCGTLKKKEALSWDDWKKENKYEWVAEQTYYNGIKTLSLKQLVNEYQNYCTSL